MDIRSDKRTRRVWLTLYAPVLLWVGFIFVMSSKIGSASETSLLVRPLLEFLFPDSPAETLDLYHWFVRKLAHLIEYALLACLALRMFRHGGVAYLAKRCAAAAITFVAVIACLDELHQSLLSSRTASPVDVLLDIAGGVFAVFAVWLLSSGRGAGSRNFVS